VVTLYQGSP